MNSTDPTAISNLSLQALQGLNATIYLTQNDRHYCTGAMVNRLLSYSTRVLRMVRRSETERAGYCLAMAMSWSFALANRLNLNLGDNLWARYPGICHHCQQGKCYCGVRSGGYKEASLPEVNQQPQSIRGFQEMFLRIYPENKLEGVAMHLAEETGELSLALEYFSNTHEICYFLELVEALSDTVALIFAIATSLLIDLGAEFERHFENGCPKCTTHIPCTCGFSLAKMV